MTSPPSATGRAAGRAALQVTAVRCAAGKRPASRRQHAGKPVPPSAAEALRLAQESMRVALSADVQTRAILRQMLAVAEDLMGAGDPRYTAAARQQAQRETLKASLRVIPGDAA